MNEIPVFNRGEETVVDNLQFLVRYTVISEVVLKPKNDKEITRD